MRWRNVGFCADRVCHGQPESQPYSQSTTATTTIQNRLYLFLSSPIHCDSDEYDDKCEAKWNEIANAIAAVNVVLWTVLLSFRCHRVLTARCVCICFAAVTYRTHRTLDIHTKHSFQPETCYRTEIVCNESFNSKIKRTKVSRIKRVRDSAPNGVNRNFGRKNPIRSVGAQRMPKRKNVMHEFHAWMRTTLTRGCFRDLWKHINRVIHVIVCQANQLEACRWKKIRTISAYRLSIDPRQRSAAFAFAFIHIDSAFVQCRRIGCIYGNLILFWGTLENVMHAMSYPLCVSSLVPLCRGRKHVTVSYRRIELFRCMRKFVRCLCVYSPLHCNQVHGTESHVFVREYVFVFYAELCAFQHFDVFELKKGRPVCQSNGRYCLEQAYVVTVVIYWKNATHKQPFNVPYQNLKYISQFHLHRL